jgi:hypothetical protein
MFFDRYIIHNYKNIIKNKYILKSKKVSFDLFTEIIYIPKYKKDIGQELWWSDSEYNVNIIAMRKEIHEITNRNPLMTLAHAKKLLYQPNNISYSSKNFA